MNLANVYRGQRIRFPRGTRVYRVDWTYWYDGQMLQVDLWDEVRRRMKNVTVHKWPGGPVRECVLIGEPAKEELHGV